MSVEAKLRNVYLDIFKFFLCYLVIAIHLTGESYPHFPLYRLAVPMFFLISGYFNYTSNVEKREERALGFIKRTFKYMAAGFLINIVFDFVICYIDGSSIGYFFTTLFYEDFWLEFVFLNRPITYTGSQLWFMIALFIVSIVHYLLVKFDKLHYYKIIVPLGFAIYFFFAGGMYHIQYTDMPYRYTRNAWFFGLPNFGLGYMLARFNFNKKSWYKYIYLLLGVLFFFLQVTEYKLWEADILKLEMYICGVLSAIFLLQFFLGIEKGECKLYYKLVGKGASFYVYSLHMAVAVALSRFITFENTMLKSFWVLVVSFLLYEIGYLSTKLVKYLIEKRKLAS